MSAVHRGLNVSPRQLVALFVAAVVAALLAGGAGGYLIRGTSTSVAEQPVTTIPASQHAVTGPLTEPHDAVAPLALPAKGSGQGPFTEPHDAITATGSGQGPFTEPHDAITAIGSGQGPFTEPHDVGR